MRWAYHAVIENARRYKLKARVEGVLVQPMAQDHVELVMGLKYDSVFGVVVMVGLGEDVAFRKGPVTLAEAGRMLDELKSKALLEGRARKSGEP